MKSPFPYHGGKSAIVKEVWQRFGSVAQYIEPFCGSAAMLLGSPQVASLEAVSDLNGFIANFWRALACQPLEVARHADWPIIHADLTSRHRWLMDQRERIAEGLSDPHWPGDPEVAGWWLWGQCAWIGTGWCEWTRTKPTTSAQIPHISNAGHGVQALRAQQTGEWLLMLATRLQRVRVLHGSWDRCLNSTYSRNQVCGVFLDPPYLNFEEVYGDSKPVARDVEAWAREEANRSHVRIALCGLRGDYDLPEWTQYAWKRPRGMSQNGSADLEVVWFSPNCLPGTQPEPEGPVDWI